VRALVGAWHNVTLLERLSHSGNLNRLADLGLGGAVRVVHHDLRSGIGDVLARQIGDQDVILHLAAMTHVDRAIEDPVGAVLDNVLATTHLLQFARSLSLKRFLYFSTDEVFGPAPAGTAYGEWDRYNSGNPYAAAKAGGEEMALAFANTYALPVIVTHTMNVYGPRQHPEKFVPLVTRKVLDGDRVLIHADPAREVSGSRHWIHAEDVASAVLFLLEHAPRECDKYNIVGTELSNLDVALAVAEEFARPLDYELIDFHSSRPGHDLRYALDGSKLAEMGWSAPADARSRIRQTARWFATHREWL
jgi:dTDP-glucose 4,6-dehydratase